MTSPDLRRLALANGMLREAPRPAPKPEAEPQHARRAEDADAKPAAQEESVLF